MKVEISLIQNNLIEVKHLWKLQKRFKEQYAVDPWVLLRRVRIILHPVLLYTIPGKRYHDGIFGLPINRFSHCRDLETCDGKLDNGHLMFRTNGLLDSYGDWIRLQPEKVNEVDLIYI